MTYRVRLMRDIGLPCDMIEITTDKRKYYWDVGQWRRFIEELREKIQ
jgi:hypothetical protein